MRISMANKHKFFGAIILIMLLSISILLRQNDLNDGVGARNLEASYHVLLTTTALRESPIINHWLLPTVSLGKLQDKNISWGATIPTKTGDYIYTSFTPPGFWAPYLWFSALNLDANVKNLAYFNVLISLFSILVLYQVLYSLLILNNQTKLSAMLGSVAGASIGIFSNEALTSNGIIYWSQSLYQLILIASILILINVLKEPQNKNYKYALIGFAFIGAMTEWTGYIFNLGLVGLFYFTNFRLSHTKIAERIFYVTVAAGFITVIYYGLATDFYSALRAFAARFIARSGKTGSLVQLVNGYSLSFGFYLIIISLLLLANKFNIFKINNQQSTINNQQSTINNQQSTINNQQSYYNIGKFAFIACLIPLFENILMLQHASQFTFDRLKFIIPAAFIISIGFANSSKKIKYVVAIFLLIAAVQGFLSYKKDLSRYDTWGKIDLSNKRFAKLIEKKYSSECTIYSSNINVRGYANLLFKHGIYERKEISDSAELIQKRNACKIIHITGKFAFSDLPYFTKATVMESNGSVDVLSVENIDKYQ